LCSFVVPKAQIVHVAIPASSATAARARGRLLLLREVLRLFRYGRSGRFKRSRLVEIFSRSEHEALHYFGLLGSNSRRKRALRRQSQMLGLQHAEFREPSADLNAWAAFCASVRDMLCKKGTPHCCDAPLFGQGSQINGKQLPLKLLVLPRHRQPGVIAKSTQGSATLRLGLRRIPIPYVRVTAATPGRSVRRDWDSIGARAVPKSWRPRDFQALTPRAVVIARPKALAAF
jgi:hypothetical protein